MGNLNLRCWSLTICG